MFLFCVKFAYFCSLYKSVDVEMSVDEKGFNDHIIRVASVWCCCGEIEIEIEKSLFDILCQLDCNDRCRVRGSSSLYGT